MNLEISPGALLAGVIFGGMGIYFFRIGKKDSNFTLLGLSLALFFYPYFVPNPWACWGIGIVLSYIAFKSLD